MEPRYFPRGQCGKFRRASGSGLRRHVGFTTLGTMSAVPGWATLWVLTTLVLVACTQPQVIPSPTPTPRPIPTPTPVATVWNPAVRVRSAPECLKVSQTGYRAQENWKPTVVGEILNNCSSSYAEVAVTVVLLNSLVNLQVDTEQKSAGPLGPGEKGSFGVSWRMRGASDPQPRAREGA